MTSTSHNRTRLTVRLLARDEKTFKVYSEGSKSVVTIDAAEEFLSEWRTATIGQHIDILIKSSLATLRGFVGSTMGLGKPTGGMNG